MRQRGLPKINWKAILSVIGIIFFILLLFYRLTGIVEKKTVKSELDGFVAQSEKAFNNATDSEIKMLSSSLEVFLEDLYFKQIFSDKDREGLYEESLPLFERLKKDFGIAYFYYDLPDGNTFLRVHDKSLFGGKDERMTFQKAQKDPDSGFGIEVEKSNIALRIVKPYIYDDQLIGYVEFGKDIYGLFDSLKNQTGNEILFFAEKKYLNEEEWKSARESAGLGSNWGDFDNYVAAYSSIESQELSSEASQKCFTGENLNNIRESRADKSFGKTELGKKIYLCGGFPVFNTEDQLIGSVMVLRDISAHDKLATQIAAVFIALLIIIFIVVFGLYRLFVEKTVTRPFSRILDLASHRSHKKPDVYPSDYNPSGPKPSLNRPIITDLGPKNGNGNGNENIRKIL